MICDLMSGEHHGKREIDVICALIAEHRLSPLDVLRIKGCGQDTLRKVIAMMHSRGYWEEYAADGCRPWIRLT